MYYEDYQYKNDEDRQFFVPFLLGGLAGSAIVGFSRPRPVYVNSPNQYQQPYPLYQQPYQQYYGYRPSSYYNYTGYQQY